jgi:fatty-acyl-CoA synthase
MFRVLVVRTDDADGRTLGDIVHRGNVVLKGYYRDTEATEKAMGDGWSTPGTPR